MVGCTDYLMASAALCAPILAVLAIACIVRAVEVANAYLMRIHAEQRRKAMLREAAQAREARR